MLKLVLLVPGLLLALSPEAALPQAAPTKPPSPDAIARVKKIYGYDCAMCHGEAGNGKGDVAADMKLTLKNYTDATSLQGLTDDQIIDIVKNGKGQMPGEGARLKDDDARVMVYIVRSFSKPESAAVK